MINFLNILQYHFKKCNLPIYLYTCDQSQNIIIITDKILMYNKCVLLFYAIVGIKHTDVWVHVLCGCNPVYSSALFINMPQSQSSLSFKYS